MRSMISFLMVTLCNFSFAQDPTVPSAQILERLYRDQPAPIAALPSASPVVQERLSPPVLKLKAMVMTDSDHGTALIEVEGRRVRLRLARPTDQLAAPEPSASRVLDGVVIQGLTYHVQDFSARSVLLTNHSQTLLIQ